VSERVVGAPDFEDNAYGYRPARGAVLIGTRRVADGGCAAADQAVAESADRRAGRRRSEAITTGMVELPLGTPVAAFRSVDHYVRERVRAFLARRRHVAGRGNRRFTWDAIHRDHGVLCLERLPRPAPLWALQ